jgi:hypothetical protein
MKRLLALCLCLVGLTARPEARAEGNLELTVKPGSALKLDLSAVRLQDRSRTARPSADYRDR